MEETMKKTIIFIIAALTAGSAFAQQTFRSTYFLDGYNFRHEFNPAFASGTSYFALPFMGLFNMETQSNMGVSTFLYPVNGQLTTFMNSAVSADEFLGKLNDKNQFNLDNRVSLLSVGIRARRSFFSFDVNMRTSTAFNLPYSLFDFMKNAGKSQTYDVSDLSARLSSRMEWAFGYSRNVTDRLNVGARVKVLVGLVNAEATIDRMDIRMTEDKWSIQSHGTLKASSFLNIPTKGESGAELDSPSDADLVDFENIDTKDNPSIVNGFGAAIDLGAEMEVIDGLKVSLSINDLGYMSWKNTVVAQTSGEGWSFDGFDEVSLDGGKENSIKNQFEDLTDDMMDMFDFRRTEKDGTNGGMISATLNIGAEYTMPFYKGLSAGFLSSTYINGSFSWSEARLYANLKPVKWFSCSANCGMSKFGATLGAVIGFHTPGFSMFIGSDHIPFRFAKATGALLYPYGKLNTNLNFGVSFNLGKRK